MEPNRRAVSSSEWQETRGQVAGMVLLIFGCSFFDPIRLRFCPLELFAIASTAHPLDTCILFDAVCSLVTFVDCQRNKWLGKKQPPAF